MPRSAGNCWWLLGVGVVGLVAAAALAPVEEIRWDGGFESVECRLRFVDNQGNPVRGVTLTVRTRAGGVSHFYPVDEFVPDVPVTSDADGRMVFHHAGQGLEFGGTQYSNVVGMQFGDTDAPRYDGVFTLDGREVFRSRLNFYRDEWKEFHRGSVTREWRSPGWDFDRYGWGRDEDHDARRLRMYDANQDGELDREERTAAGNHTRRLEREYEWLAAVEAGRAPAERPRAREVSFLVIERTVAVPNR